MLLLRAFVLCLAFAALPAWSESFRVTAKPGQFNARTLAKPAPLVSFSGTAKLLAFASSPQWPAASYIGVHEGLDRNNSVQVLAIQNRPTDEYLVLGYRLVVGGKEMKVQSLDSVPVNSAWKVQIGFDRGVVRLEVNGGLPIQVQTPFKQVAPYVSVSSGEAEFSIDL